MKHIKILEKWIIKRGKLIKEWEELKDCINITLSQITFMAMSSSVNILSYTLWFKSNIKSFLNVYKLYPTCIL